MRVLMMVALMGMMMAGQVMAAEWKRLLEPQDLKALVGTGIKVLDIRSPAEYARSHMPGAINAPYGAWRGPRGNPGQPLDDARLTDLMQGLGLVRADRVVITYLGRDATDFGSAARVYWTLKSAGFQELAILNGGLASWVDAGGPLTAEVVPVTRSSEVFSLADTWMISREGVMDVVSGRADAQIVDARPPQFLAGKIKHPQARAAGTLQGAAQLTHSTWFEGQGQGKRRIGTREDILARARAAGVETGGRRPVASFCNTGHWAATNWFALSELAGIENVKLYPESMVGWTGAGAPVVTAR